MRIVDLKTFLAMPEGTVFMKYDPCGFTDLGIKADGFGYNGDFWYVDLTSPHFAGEGGSDDWTEILDAAEKGKPTPPLDLETVSRDGLYRADQLFAVYERQDIEAIIVRLQRALKDAEA